ncbi:hypothetical protein [Paraburkholderia phenoliruptrix]|uniref:hypothetical protein n=1 Tax=Paraburkholderia phenoliruptrix TaxID=252970 RepID=UPI001C6F0CE7|nr:hypothetical protein [Paraburkholderia phenoliruptrix]MBW9107859.1 hypothetical protein [Paraburkholderia phenoliruptrix]MBW9133104.1 hypothetical protein [Paraburkholderia ginsengiterrae]
MGDRPLIQHTVCIDLPGEPVECWAETDLTVLLRKHRDVIFDIQVKKGATYTVEASEDWIYDVARKKRVKQGQFQDGQRYHIWISRDFKGQLTLKQNGKAYQSYSMRTFGLANTDPSPKAKPEPIIIAIGTNHAAHLPTASASSKQTNAAPLLTYPQPAIPEYLRPAGAFDPLRAEQLWSCPLPIKLAPGTTVEPAQEAHVFEVDKSSIPKQVMDALAAGGSEDTAIDTNNIATRNWLIGQLAGATAFLKDNKQWIQELWREKFRLMKIVHKNVGERTYVVFTGNPRLRKLVTAARYGVQNEKVLTIAGGAGTAASGAAAAWEGSKGAFKKAGLIALIFTITLDTAEWLHDYEDIGPDGKRKKDIADLLGKIGIDLAKAGLSAAIASVAVGAAVALLAGTVALPVAAIVVGTIVVAIAVGYGLDWLDKKTHATEHVTSWFRSIGESIKHAAEYLEKSMPKDYDQYPMMYMP